MENKVFGDYVLTAIPNAFNKKTSWWLSKKGYTAAMYCFSTSGSERQQILESKSHIENIQSYIDCYELRFGDKQNKAEKEDPYMVETNIGMVPIAEYCDIMAMQSGYDDYADMRSHGVRLGGGMDEKLAVYNFEGKILRSLEAKGFDTSKINLEIQDFIDEEHKRCIWYGGVVATVEYKNHIFRLIAHGDISITSYSDSEEDSNKVEFDYSNKNNTGAYHNKEALAYFVNDAHFDELFQECRFACRGHNWFEILIETPDGVISNLGRDGVCVSNYIDECIEQMILTMDDMLENLHKREAQEPDVTLEKVHERKVEEPAITLRAKTFLYNAIGVACGGMDEKPAVYNFESKILRSLEAQGFDTSKIVLNVQDFIDEEHKRCVWYGGVVATVEYKDHVFWLEAHGDVSITSYSEENSNKVEFDYSNKNNTGAYHNDEALAYFVNDARFDELNQADRLVWGNNNWFEVLVETPDGVKSDFGLDGVCDSDFLDECIEEMILTMDDMLNNINSNKSDTTTTLTLERAKILLYNAIDVASGFYQNTEIEELKKSIGITDAELKAIGFEEVDSE